MPFFSIPDDSNLHYLPLVYYLPEALIARCPTLRELPRRIMEVITSDELMAIVESEQFLSEILDAGALLAFPHFGFGGWKEDYTGIFPVWQLSYLVRHWCQQLEIETGWGLQRLVSFPSHMYVRFFDPNEVDRVMRIIVQKTIEQQHWQPILDAIREMPCEEDFEPHKSNVRKDFYRKWYHSRSKRVQMVSLESCKTNNRNDIHKMMEAPFEDGVISEDFCKRFKETLSEKDMEILELRLAGLRYEEIGKRLGYKNHSGIVKRIRAIAKAFRAYENEYGL